MLTRSPDAACWPRGGHGVESNRLWEHMMGYYVGLDLGGTTIKTGLVDENGRVVAKDSVSTARDGDAGAIIGAMVEAIETIRHAWGGCAGCGRGHRDRVAGADRSGNGGRRSGAEPSAAQRGAAAGPDRRRDRPARRDRKRRQTPRYSPSTGSAWARDEAIRDVVMLTLGTGIGSGVIINGSLLQRRP